MKKAMWIWTTENVSHHHEMVAFRKRFVLEQIPETYPVEVCADSRYVLLVNGKYVAAGPARGKASERYLDTIDLAPYLHLGENILYAEAVHYAETPLTRNTFSGGPISVETTAVGGFLLKDSGALELSTDVDWECGAVEGHSFIKCSEDFIYLGYTDQRDYRCKTVFHPAAVRYNSELYIMGGLANIWTLSPRPIPLPYEQQERFIGAKYCVGIEEQVAQLLLKSDTPVVVPPHTAVRFLADPGLYKTAFPYATLEGGAGAELRFRYTEKFKDKHLQDYLNSGSFPDELMDVFVLDGQNREIRPFLYRAFRYIVVEIQTKDEPLVLSALGCYRTGYPLSVTGRYTASEQTYTEVWKTSLNTLECCMYETYMDCPYYEQMQYAMDTFLEILYTFQVSADDRLARKAIDDFARSQLYTGMFPCTAPSGFTQIIPGFSIYWILMLHTHYRYFGDTAFIARYVPELEKLLSFYVQHISSETGLIENTGYWQFVDWVNEWERGCPSGKEDNYIYSMMISFAFRLASDLYAVLGDLLRSHTYMTYADSLNVCLNLCAWDENEQLYLDAPDSKMHSQHAQLWAVLADVCTGQRTVDILKKTLDGPYSKVSYCMSYFLFRALEKVGLYEHTRELLVQWQQFVTDGATTYPEDPVTQRSECHAWGSVPLYDFAACHLGVTPLKEGYAEVGIQPKALWLNWCKGTVATCKGDINVSWTMEQGVFSISVSLPQEMKVRLVLPDGRKKTYDHVLKIQETCSLN